MDGDDHIRKVEAERTEKMVQDVEKAVGVDTNAGDYLFEDDKAFKNTHKDFNQREKTLGYRRAEGSSDNLLSRSKTPERTDTNKLERPLKGTVAGMGASK